MCREGKKGFGEEAGVDGALSRAWSARHKQGGVPQGLCTYVAGRTWVSNAGRSRSSLNTVMPESWPAASRFCSGWAARIQKRSLSRRNVCTPRR